MDNLKDIVSRSLKRLINDEKRITQTKLAKKIGRSQPLISGMMSGNSPGNEEDRRKIADVLKMSYEEFLNYGKIIVEPKPANSKSPPELSSEADELQRELITVYRDLTEAQKTIARLTARIAELESNRQDSQTGPQTISSNGIL